MYPILSGMRVVECTSFIAAPSCALHLLQLGVEVIRIDPIGGGPDFNRWPVSTETRPHISEANIFAQEASVTTGSPSSRRRAASSTMQRAA
jgi:crotonobetainyl-CoA:carnitine CoA-transferase CaiB-like acyl-CoA transferase